MLENSALNTSQPLRLIDKMDSKVSNALKFDKVNLKCAFLCVALLSFASGLKTRERGSNWALITFVFLCFDLGKSRIKDTAGH